MYAAQGFDPFRAADAIMGGRDTAHLAVTPTEIAQEDEIWQAWLDLAIRAQRESDRVIDNDGRDMGIGD